MVLAAYLRQTAAFELERAQVNLIFTYLYELIINVNVENCLEKSF